MKLISGYFTQEEAEDLQAFLEENGIAVYVQYAHNKGSGFKYLVYAALDAQYEDALQLMANPRHVVAKKVDIAEYQEFTWGSEGSSAARNAILKVVLWALLVGGLVAGAVLYLVLSRK